MSDSLPRLSQDRRRRPSAARGFSCAALGWLAAVLAAGAATPPPPSSLPRAQVVDVKVAFLQQGSVRHSGAGVRSFRDPDPESGGSERFDVRWYANPPGIPPGAVLLLETVPERGAAVKNHVLRTTANSQGYVRSAIDVPAAEIRRSGRTRDWRLRIVWRGRVLASRTSPGWERRVRP